jgi:hypothetical protein
VRHIIFKQDGVWYGVALEFNIVEEGDNPVEVMVSLFEAIQGYVQTAQKCKMSAAPLNQTPDKEYQKLWEKLSKSQVAGNKNENHYRSIISAIRPSLPMPCAISLWLKIFSIGLFRI